MFIIDTKLSDKTIISYNYCTQETESKGVPLLTWVLHPDILFCDLDSCSHKSLMKTSGTVSDNLLKLYFVLRYI